MAHYLSPLLTVLRPMVHLPAMTAAEAVLLFQAVLLDRTGTAADRSRISLIAKLCVKVFTIVVEL